MGIDMFFRVCSYVKCKKIFKDQFIEYKICSNKKCKEKDEQMYGSSCHFCSLCGKKMSIKKKSISSAPSINAYDIFGDNSLFPAYEISEEYDYFISNIADKNEPKSIVINARNDCSNEISIEQNLPEKHLSWFKNKYKKQIQTLEKIYGKENIETKYGVIFEVC